MTAKGSKTTDQDYGVSNKRRDSGEKPALMPHKHLKLLGGLKEQGRQECQSPEGRYESKGSTAERHNVGVVALAGSRSNE